ncbi:hypothetical protein FAVG1_12449 [Fusarium avenaceum]|nr:hypothetical protein FAVG1_12449 [Fusarium avenaceum]
MSSSAPRSGERMIHQDFIARIRFSNALPPPPHPPKLLDIPNTGLASGQYTTPGFASRLAREQPLNIEADAELGMPLDLVGMPGVFDGDERSIQAPAHPPTLHPHDRPLLRPIAALGKHKAAEANVSFLRRTEYISSSISKRQEALAPRALLAKAKRRLPEPAADSPHAIKRKIDKGFEIAEQEFKDPKRVKHPSKKNLKLVDVSPLIPDLDAFPDSGAYVTIKFHQNPLVSTKGYDKRLLNGLFRPIDRNPHEEEAFEAAVAAHEQDPANNPKPQNLMNYEYYLAASGLTAEHFRRRFEVEDNDHLGEEEGYTHKSDDAEGCFQYHKVRAYETSQETEFEHTHKFDEEIILSYNDDTFYPNQKAVYYYPVMQKSVIRPQRTKNIARNIGIADEEQTVDQLDVTVEDPRQDMRELMKSYRDNPLGTGEDEEEEEHHEGHDAEGEDDAGHRSRSASEERDAEGEDEE